MRKFTWLGAIFGVLIVLSLFLPRSPNMAGATTFTEMWQPQVTVASPATAYYDPTSDVQTEWDCTGTDCGTGHYAVVNDGTRQPNAPSTIDDYISVVANVVATDEHQVDAVTESGINYVRLYYYANTGNRAQIDVKLQSDGVTQASYSLPPNSGAAWRYVEWITSSVGTITGEFTIVDLGTGKPENGFVYAWYLEVDYTISSITVTDGNVAYGTLELSATKNTVLYNETTNPNGMTPADTQTATNNGTVAERFQIKSSNAIGGTNWTLGAAQGSNTFTHEFSTNGGGSWTAMTVADTYYDLAASVPFDGSQTFDLQIGMPTSITDYGEHTITVTVLATAAGS